MNSICEQLVAENGAGWVYVFLRIELIATMESYRDAPNPRIRVGTRIDPPAPRDRHCTEPHLVGCPAHARIGEVTLHDCGRAICGADRLGSSRSVGSANAYRATIESPPVVPTILFGLLIPLALAAIGLWQSASVARLVSAIPLHWLVAAQVYRIGGGIFLLLWADGRLPWQFALPAGNRRPRRGNRHGGNDLFGTSASSCVRRAEPSHDSLSAGDGAYLRRPTRPDVAWPRFVARLRRGTTAAGRLVAA